MTDNIPPLTHELSEAVCPLAQLPIEHAATATLGVGEEDRGEVIKVLTIGEKTENGGPAFVAETLGRPIKTIVETDLVDRGTGPRSRVRRINLGRLDRHCFESAARNFPPGLCRLGSGTDAARSSIAQPA